MIKIKWEMGDFSKLIKNAVNQHNLTDYTSFSQEDLDAGFEHSLVPMDT